MSTIEAGVIVVRCPDCSWKSEPSTVYSVPNGAWYARQRPMSAYRQHRHVAHWVEPIVHHIGGSTQRG